ncbi:fasciclin domain-containing protein [Sphingobacterium sp.]|uniref:fasciclin domain-containing protein n=1 Tax=Sphingobacterium sp. TaxID=341027 RepID=UPI00258AE403|nr:fasciclin domain-containing protein [Sphingobacterium sp.]WET67019.1 MAG: fasciclin domain-containing protein [Sphingobacterium sp.]
MKSIKYLYSILLVLTFTSCSKDAVNPDQGGEKNTLNDVVRDNFGLSYLATALYKSGLNKTLAQPGMYTLIAPSDDAYRAAGYQNPAALYAEPADKLGLQGNYHILKNPVVFTGKPLKMNQEEETLLGTKLYWSRVKRGQDTLTTINGGRLLQADTKASNGIMQVLDRLLVPNVHLNLKQALAANADLSLFYQALKVSGMLETLAGNSNYTVFAPNNIALKQSGYPDLEAIEKADPAVLKTMLSYHIAKERKFAQDYFLLAPEGTTSYTEKMLDEKTITINLLSQYNVPNSFTGITIKGLRNPGTMVPVRTDVLAGNGVIHVIGQVLR